MTRRDPMGGATRLGNIFGNLPVLETERLRLRKLTRADIPDVFAYASDAEVSAQTTWNPHQTQEQSRQFVERVLRVYQYGEVGPWGVEHKGDGRIIGTCGFNDLDTYHRRAEIGYALARPYWNLGLTTEAVTAVLRFGFGRLLLNRIQAMCLTANIGSARVMEKAGMRYEGLLRSYAYIKGDYRDLKLYAILREDWLQMQEDPRTAP